jgi:hypothetical protein
VPFDDLPDDRETDPRAPVPVVGVEAAERLEDPVEILGFDPDPAVLARELDHAVRAPGRDRDGRRHAVAVILQGVADQIHEDLFEPDRIGHDGGTGPTTTVACASETAPA